MSGKVSIGRIRGYHGIKGHVKMQPYFSFAERMEAVEKVWVAGSPYRLESARLQGSIWVLKFWGLDSREDAEALQGKEAFVPQEERFPLPEDHYYVDDLVGLEVYEETGRFLGKIRDVLLTGANDVYVISPPPQAEGLPGEILFPALKHLVVEMNLPEGKVVVKILEGLLQP